MLYTFKKKITYIIYTAYSMEERDSVHMEKALLSSVFDKSTNSMDQLRLFK